MPKTNEDNIMFRSIMHSTCLALLCCWPAVAQNPTSTTKDEPDKQTEQRVYKDDLHSVAVPSGLAEDVAKTLNDQFESFKFTANTSIDRIYFRAPDSVKKQVIKTIEEMAQDAAMHRAEQQQKAEDADTYWQG